MLTSLQAQYNIAHISYVWEEKQIDKTALEGEFNVSGGFLITNFVMLKINIYVTKKLQSEFLADI